MKSNEGHNGNSENMLPLFRGCKCSSRCLGGLKDDCRFDVVGLNRQTEITGGLQLVDRMNGYDGQDAEITDLCRLVKF